MEEITKFSFTFYKITLRNRNNTYFHFALNFLKLILMNLCIYEYMYEQHCRLNNNQTALNSRYLRASSDGPIPGRYQVLTKEGLGIA